MTDIIYNSNFWLGWTLTGLLVVVMLEFTTAIVDPDYIEEMRECYKDKPFQFIILILSAVCLWPVYLIFTAYMWYKYG